MFQVSYHREQMGFWSLEAGWEKTESLELEGNLVFAHQTFFGPVGVNSQELSDNATRMAKECKCWPLRSNSQPQE